jgi:hypothetical protein
MRVTKTTSGSFVVDDEPMRLTGKAAKEFVSAMKSGASTPERSKFLAECEQEYRAKQATKKA